MYATSNQSPCGRGSTVAIPETGFLRLNQIIGSKKAQPPITPLIPVSRSTWLEGCRTGRYPKPLKLSPGVTVWRVEDIRALIAQAAE